MFQLSGLSKRSWRKVGVVSLGLGLSVTAIAGNSANAADRSAINRGLNASIFETVATDSFSRTTTDGYGSADLGGKYTVFSDASLSVIDGHAQIDRLDRGKSIKAILKDTSVLNADVQSTLSIPVISNQRVGLYDSLVLRSQANGDQYFAKTYIGANGKVVLSSSFAHKGQADVGIGTPVALPITLKSGDQLVVEARIVGTTPTVIMERAWIKGSVVPEFQYRAIDKSATAIKIAGSVGYWSYLSKTGTPTPISHDDLKVVSMHMREFHGGGGVTTTTAPKVTTTSTAPATTTTSTTNSSTTAKPTTTTTVKSTTTTTVPLPGNNSSTFTFAVMPDTQQEVLRATDTRFLNRTNWLAANQQALNLKFVTHTGDVNNWDTPDHSQYVVSSAAMVPLQKAGIPYSLAIGNHDTEATGVGGSARDPHNTRALQRDTTTFNTYFKASQYTHVGGAFEPNKVDNIYSTFDGGGKKWMVIVLEFNARTSVIDWAKNVVATHPDYNVIIATHSYLNSDGSISSNAEYGDNSGQYVYDNLVSKFPNVKMVFSGHVGIAGSRTDTAVNGNKIASMLQTYHSNTTNPVRLVQVDTANGTIKSWVYAPYTNETLSSGAANFSGMAWVG